MTQRNLEMIKEFEGNIKAIAGEAAAKKVMEGAAVLKPSTSKKKLAEWMKSAIERLDSIVPEKQRIGIMEACGQNCAKINQQAVMRFKKRRQKYPTIEAFLEAEEIQPMSGTKLKREGNAFIQIYTPLSFTHPMRCYCNLVNGLPANQTMSRTYCHCSKALVKRMWEEALEKPVQVDLLQSAISGDTECHFKITF